MISRAYIHEYGNGKVEPEHADICDVLKSRGIEYELFTTKKLHRNQLKLDEKTLVVGDHPTIQSVLKRIGYSNNLSTYPNCLRSLLLRQIRETTIGKLLDESNSSGISNVFIKPKSKSKLFTGFVASSQFDLLTLSGFARNTELFISQLVEWKSEYRVFVCNSEIIGIKHYKGENETGLDLEVVKNAIELLENSDEKTSGYAIDFGILSSGETALIEWNDGFALGSYQLDKEQYSHLIISRWEEILGTVNPTFK